MGIEASATRSTGVIALVMAAGKSRRFGSDKRQARLIDGQTLLGSTLALAQQNFSETWLMLGATDDPHELNIPASVRVLHAPSELIGLGTSLGAAFQALLVHHTHASAAAVMLADMPWILPQTCQRLIRVSHPEGIVRPRFGSRAGHPVVFGRSFWAQLAMLNGEEGARQVIADNSQVCSFIDLDDPNINTDIDVPEDLDDQSSSADRGS